ENEFRKIAAVAAFEHVVGGNAERANLLAEPVKILRLQRLLRERIAGVGIETSRDADEFRTEFLHTIQRRRQHVSILSSGQGGRHGIIETIVAEVARASSGISGVLVDGKKCGAVAVQQNVLRAVAVMDIK